MIPVVFISRTLSYRPELQLVVEQAKKNNEEVFLLGDEGNKQYCPSNHYNITDYSEGVKEFEECYEHLSTNDKEIEKFCFSRWFVLRNFLRSKNFEGALYLDNDILLFTNATPEFEKRKHLYCVLSGRTSGHSSYWTLKGVEAFCDYLMEIYTNKRSYDYQRLASHFYVRRQFGLEGGLCDMTLLESFARYKCSHLVGEVSIVTDGLYYDHVIQEAEGFEQEYGIKKFVFRNGIPYAKQISTQEDIPFATIHFQGSHKPLIETFIKLYDDSLI